MAYGTGNALMSRSTAVIPLLWSDGLDDADLGAHVVRAPDRHDDGQHA